MSAGGAGEAAGGVQAGSDSVREGRRHQFPHGLHPGPRQHARPQLQPARGRQAQGQAHRRQDHPRHCDRHVARHGCVSSQLFFLLRRSDAIPWLSALGWACKQIASTYKQFSSIYKQFRVRALCVFVYTHTNSSVLRGLARVRASGVRPAVVPGRRAGVPGALQGGAIEAHRGLPQHIRQPGAADVLHGGARPAEGHRA